VGEGAGAVAGHVDDDEAARAHHLLQAPIAAVVQTRGGDAHTGVWRDAVQVHGLGEAGGAARAREQLLRVAAHYCVQEGGFAHVGAPHKGYFGYGGFGHEAELGDAAEEGGALAVAVEEGVCVGFVGGRGRGGLVVPVVVVGARGGR
jgi:hypothetical protein